MIARKTDFLIIPTDLSGWDFHVNDFVQFKNGKSEAKKSQAGYFIF